MTYMPSGVVCFVCGREIHDVTGFTDGGVIADATRDYWFCSEHHKVAAGYL